jgi:hypothetical protein
MWHAWEMRGMCTSFGGNARRKEALGRPRRRWEDGSEWILGRVAG